MYHSPIQLDVFPTDAQMRRIDPARNMRRILSNERLNKKVKRRAEVVGIFPNEVSIMRLIMIPSHLRDYTTMTDATKQ